MMLLVLGLPMLCFLSWTQWFLAKRDQASRRPFDEMPRPPGWSLQQRANDLIFDYAWQFMAATLVGVLAWALAISGKVNAPVMLGMGLAGCAYLLWRATRTIKRFANHRLGFLGEQVVGQILDQFSATNARIFHDLEVQEPGKKPWNIDHVVVSPSGVFVIETKCRRKPKGAPGPQKSHQLIFDGQQIVFPAPMKPDRHGLDQAQRNADWLSQKLGSLNGEPVPVTPALVFPGWWVEAKGKGPVTVLNAKQLPNFLTGRPTVLSERLLTAISNQLAERCRIDLSSPS